MKDAEKRNQDRAFKYGLIALVALVAAIVATAALVPAEPKWMIVPPVVGFPTFMLAQRWEVRLGSMLVSTGNSWNLRVAAVFVAVVEIVSLVIIW